MPTTILADVSETLLMVLLHSLWQVTCIALVVMVVLRFIPAKSTNLRYSAATGSLLLVLVSVLATWSVLRIEAPNPQAPIVVQAMDDVTIGNATTSPSTSVSSFVQVDPRSPAGSPIGIAPWIIALWALGCGCMLVRAFRGLAEVRVLAVETQPTTEEARLLDTLRGQLKELCLALRMRSVVTLQQCSGIASPAVVGIFRPVVLIPAAMLSGNTLSLEDWRVVLAHELAHVRRLDGLINVAQLLLESVLFFNPCLWWLSRQVRVEREACCDALAAQVTGQPLSVARTLLAVAESIQQTSHPRGAYVPAAALAVANPQEPGSLRDRVNRLADPEHPPRGQVDWVRFTWLSLALSLVAIVGAGFALQRGTDIVVRSAAAMLTPQQRVDQLARLQVDHTGHYAPPADGDETRPDDPGRPTSVNVHIVVKTEDGSPISGRLSVVGALKKTQGSLGTSLAYEEDCGPVFEMDHRFEHGVLAIAASAEGFAPAVSEQLHLRPDTPDPTVELILGQGFEQTVIVEDEYGVPVSDIDIRVRGQLQSNGIGMGLNYAEVAKIVVDGQIALKQLSEDVGYEFFVQSPGWEFQQTVRPIQQSEPTVLRVRRAQATPLTVVDGETGAPIADAALQVVGWVDKNNASAPTPRMGDPRARAMPDPGWVFGKTDSDGIATVDMLNRDQKYLLVVVADGYQPEFIQPVQSGVDAGVVRLTKAVVFEGRVTGDLTKLSSRKRNGQQRYRLQYRNDLKFPEQNYSGLLAVELDADGHFRIDDLVAGGMKFSLPGGYVTLPTGESRTDIALNIEANTEENERIKPAPHRTVEIQLTGLKDSVLVRGSLRVQWQKDGRWAIQVVPVVRRSAKLEVPIGVTISVREKGLVGCTFREQRRIEVTAGAGIQTVPVVAQPAGGVFGRVHRADGSPAIDASVTVLEIEEPPSGRIDPNPSVRGSSDGFFRTVPFGGRYAILAREFNDDHTVWAVSDSFTIDENNPIQELQLTLGAGERTTVQILDPAGSPVVGAPAGLSVGHSSAGHSHSQGTAALTDANGIADFGLVQMRGSAGDAKVTISVEVRPFGRFTGWRDKLDTSRNDFRVNLKRAVAASGVVVDHESGEPLPEQQVVVYPADLQAAAYTGHIRTRTDADGRFLFTGLEATRYHLMVPGTARPEAVVIKQPGGGYRFEYPVTPTEMFLTGGNEKMQTYKVQVVD